MKHTILIVDDTPIFRQMLGTALQRKGYDTIEAASGPDGLLVLGQRPVSAMLLDLSMPGMDGLAVLAAVREMPASKSMPVLLLTADSQREHVAQAAALGVSGYILKGRLSLPELFTRLERSLGAVESAEREAANLPKAVHAALDTPPTPSAAPKQTAPAGVARHPAAAPAIAGTPEHCPVLLSREQTMLRLGQVVQSCAAAGIISQVLALASSPRSDMADLVRVIKCDPSLASRVLQMANSAAFMSAKPLVATIDEAARNIGFNGIHSVAVSFSLISAFPPDGADGFNSVRCWQHSIAVAGILEQLLPETGEYTRAIYHLIGLCHDLGEIVLRQNFQKEFETIIDYARTHNVPVRACEAVALSIPHHELISLILHTLALPHTIAKPIEELHARGHQTLRDGGLPARALAIANYLASAMQLSPSPHGRVRPITHHEWKSLGHVPPKLNPVSYRVEVLTTTSAMARLNKEHDDRLMQPHFRRTTKRIWYARHKLFGDPDPLEIALDSMANVTVNDRLPATPGEWGKLDGVVVAALRGGTSPLSHNDIHAARIAGDKNNLPVLSISGDAQPPSTDPSLMTAVYPLELAELAGFVESL